MKVARIRRSPVPRLASPFGIGGTNPMPALDDLADVDATSPADGNTIVWDSGSGTWVPGSSGGAAALDDLTDVDVPAPADGDVLTWDDYLGLWVNVPPADFDLSAATELWRPLMVDAPSIVTTDGLPIYVPLVLADGTAIMVYL